MTKMTEDQEYLLEWIEGFKPGKPSQFLDTARTAIIQANCDCVRSDISSKSCRKCGRNARISNRQVQAAMIELTQLKYKLGQIVDLEERTSSQQDIIDKVWTAMVEAEKIAHDHS